MKLAILMSTYNGEKFLEEQLKSLINQTIKSFEIIIRDDGSTDNTVRILKEYEKEYSNITVIEGMNIGVSKSFMELLKYNIDADFFAFCDQDDIWEKDKLENAVNNLKTINNLPALYYTEVKAVDNELKVLFKSNYTGIDTLGASFNTTPVIGCTVVMNKMLREKIIGKKIPDDIVMHDLYAYRVCLAIGGIVVHDRNSYILYRQHENNVVGITKSPLKKMKAYKKFNNTRSIMAQNILDIYGDDIPENNKKILLKVANFNDKLNLLKKIVFMMDKDFKSKKIKSDIKFIYDILFENI